MICRNCGRPIDDDADVCPFCGKESDRSIAKRMEAAAAPETPVAATPPPAEKTRRKKVFLGVGLAAAAAVVVLAVVLINANKGIDPAVLAQVEEQSIQELYNSSLRRVENKLKHDYPSYLLKFSQPNASSGLRASNAEDGIYPLEVYVDVTLTSGSGSVVGSAEAELTANVRLLDKKGTFALSGADAEITSAPNITEEGPASEPQTSSGPPSRDMDSARESFLEKLQSSCWISESGDILRFGGSEYGLNVQRLPDLESYEPYYNGYITDYDITGYNDYGDFYIEFNTDPDEDGYSLSIQICNDSDSGGIYVFEGDYRFATDYVPFDPYG